MVRDDDEAAPRRRARDARAPRRDVQAVFDELREARRRIAGDRRSTSRYQQLFVELHGLMAPRVRSLVAARRHRIRPWMELEDLVQQVFVRIHLHCEQCRDDAEGWIVRITQNLLNDEDGRVKRSRETPASSLADPSEDDTGFSSLEAGFGRPRHTGRDSVGHSRIEQPDGRPLAEHEWRWFLNFARHEYLMGRSADEAALVPVPMLQRSSSDLDWSRVTNTWIVQSVWKARKGDLNRLLPRLRDLALFDMTHFGDASYEEKLLELRSFMQDCFEAMARSGEAVGTRAAKLDVINENAARKAVAGVKRWLVEYAVRNRLRITGGGWWVAEAD